jgi:dCTP deaminase
MNPSDQLFEALPEDARPLPGDGRKGALGRTGILPSQALRQLIAAGEIAGAPAIEDGQIQPASLDLRLGKVAYRVRASFLPGTKATVRDSPADR